MADRHRDDVLGTLRARRDVGPSPGSPRLSVVVPAYREVGTVATSIARIRHDLADVGLGGDLEIVVVDDGSADGTGDAARRAGADRVLDFALNRGKGAAVRAGMLEATGACRVFTDADLSYAPAQIAGLLAAVEDGWDVVVGNRHDPSSTTVVEAGLVRRIGGRAINLATRSVLVDDHPDTQCGLKGFRGDVADVLFGHSHVDGFAFDVELIHLAERYGLSLVAVPVEVENTDTSTVRVARDAMRLLGDLVNIRRWAASGRYDLDAGERALVSAGRPGSGD